MLTSLRLSLAYSDLLQVLTVVAMERPVSFEAEDVRDEKVRALFSIMKSSSRSVAPGDWGKRHPLREPIHLLDDDGISQSLSQVKVLRAIAPITQEDTLLGQYVSANGKPGYLDDDTVPKGSVCPTFAATTLYINNPRWEGVPFILKAGKG